MGIYDQLSKLSQTPSVASSEPSKSVEHPTIADLPEPLQGQAIKKITTPKRQAPKPEFDPKVLLDRPASRQRIITRASFEVYQDQLHVLRQVSLSAKLSGEQLSISEMVREALDSYLTDKNLK